MPDYTLHPNPGTLISQFQAGASTTLIGMFLLLLFVVILRREWLAWTAKYRVESSSARLSY